MDLDTLRFGNFSQLGEAITDWEQMTKKLLTLKNDAEQNLKKKADRASWAGVNATVSREFIDKTAGEFGDAHTQAETITNILSDTHGELKDYRTQLNEAIEGGRKNSLSVTDTGDGTFRVQGPPPLVGQGPPVPEPPAGALESLKTQIEGILTKATESDRTAAEALRLIVDQAKYGFSGVSYENRDGAAEAIKKADEISKILKKDPDDISNTELNSLNTALAKYKNDPLFAEKVATDVGAKRVMQFYAEAADDSQFSVNPRSRQGLSDEQKQRMKLLSGLEKQLGTTLATASHSDSDAMQKWKSDVIANGGTNVRPNGQNPVYGFQVMSNFMRNGTFDKDFMHDYGTELIDYEKKHKSDEYAGLQRHKTREDVLPWDKTGGYERLHYGASNDAGTDPMTGFMEGLGHNAEASTEFFNEGKNFDYLTEEREWPKDYAETGAKTIAGYDSLGHALESATTGAAYDSHPPELHRDADTAKVAESVVQRYGQDAEYKDDKQTGLSGAQLMQKQQGIGDSLGKIGSAYIDDINWAMNGGGDKSLYAMDNGERSSLSERAHFNEGNFDVTKFISAVGQDPDGYASLGTAQQVYTTSLTDAHPPTIEADGDVNSTQAETSIRTGAEVQGVLDKSRAEEIKAEGVEADKKYNDAVDARIERDKVISGVVTGGFFSLVPEPATGLAATVVPIASGQAEGVTGALIDHNLDQYAEAHHRDNSEKSHADGNDIFASGNKASWQPGYSLLERADESDKWPRDKYQDLNEALIRAQNLGYTRGSQNQENVGQLPTPQ
ncbi:hypothetical protein ABZS88_36340 [Streptomyces sp. NPDC005480]|uniref:hypothetical protein n=1 Tax=Streptomyces sp. NPDC005480 TaxID=3154880 RepID=UPI0033A87EFE